MAYRYPLYWDTGANEGLREMNATQVSAISDRAIYYFAQNPSVTLSVKTFNQVINGDRGNLAEMYDTYWIAGRSYERADRFGTPEETPDIELRTVTYDYINEDITTDSTADPADTNNIRFPVYLDDDNNIRSMSQQDFIDTFISPAIVNLTKSASSNDRKGGTYVIHSTGDFAPTADEIPDYLELVDSSPVYKNSYNDPDDFSAANIPYEDPNRDQSITPDVYYLYRYKGADAAPDMLERPLFLTTNDANANLREYSDSMIDGLLEPAILHQARTSGNKITYAISTSSTANNRRGTMIDTRLNGASADGFNSRLLNADSYYTQEFPNGVEVVNQTYYLTCSRV